VSVRMKRAADFAGAIRGDAGERVNVFGGWDGKQQPVDFSAAGSAWGRRVGRWLLTDSQDGDGGVTLDGDGIVGNDRTT